MIECPKCHQLVPHSRYQIMVVHEGCPQDAERRQAAVKRASRRPVAVSYARKPFARRP